MFVVIMAARRIGVLAALSEEHLSHNMTSSTGARGGTSIHGNVNILLSGAMLSGLILIVFIICYCCHRNMSKQANRNAQYWHEEPDVPLEIFTVDGQCYEVAGVLVPTSDSCGSLDAVVIPTTPPGPPPPPSYDAVVSADEEEKKKKMHQRRISHVVDAEKGSRDQQEDDGGLPSYEAALRFEAQGYV